VTDVPPAVALAIERFSPKTVDADVSSFSRQVTYAAGPTTLNRAKALLFASSHIASYAKKIGLDLDPAVVLQTSLIERYSSECQMSQATKRTLRANLRALSSQAQVSLPPPPAYPRDRAKSPYTKKEIASYLSQADSLPTDLQRKRAQALICLGAGAGLIGGELRRVRGTDVVKRSGGLLVSVGGRRNRVVPVLRDFHDRLVTVSEHFCDSYLVSGPNPDSHNVTNPLIRALSAITDLPRLEPPRLRCTWLVSVAGQIGLRGFMEAAGVTCSQRLGDLVCYLDPIEEETVVTLLGASS
jgi:integrase